MYTKLVQARALYPPVSDPPLKIYRERLPGATEEGRRLNGLKFHRVNLRRNIRRWPLRNQSREREREREEREEGREQHGDFEEAMLHPDGVNANDFSCEKTEWKRSGNLSQSKKKKKTEESRFFW